MFRKLAKTNTNNEPYTLYKRYACHSNLTPEEKNQNGSTAAAFLELNVP